MFLQQLRHIVSSSGSKLPSVGRKVTSKAFSKKRGFRSDEKLWRQKMSSIHLLGIVTERVKSGWRGWVCGIRMFYRMKWESNCHRATSAVLGDRYSQDQQACKSRSNRVFGRKRTTVTGELLLRKNYEDSFLSCRELQKIRNIIIHCFSLQSWSISLHAFISNV